MPATSLEAIERKRQATKLRLRRIRAENPGWSTNKNRKWEEKNPLARLAHKVVERALVSGRLIQQPCDICGSHKSQAHHKDYSKPLKVRWLCQAHHIEAEYDED